MRAFRAAAVCALMLTGCLTACSLGYTEGEYFFISREGSDMPVWVRGNLDSEVFLLFLHGGPGDTSQYVHRFKAFEEIERRYAVVYWDQRCSGISSGNATVESMTVDEFTRDLGLLVDTVSMKYAQPVLFLLGVSWGGTLATAYLADSGAQAGVSGWIDVGGGHNMVLLMQLSTALLAAHAANRVAEAQDAEYWAEAVQFFADNPDPTAWGIEEFMQYAEYLRRAEVYTYAPERYEDEFTGPTADLVFCSPLSLSLFFNPGRLLPNFNILSLDLTAEMAEITIPTLLAWGRYDVNSPVEMAQHAYDHLGTPEADKRLRIFESSGHTVFVDEPEAFLEELFDFVEAYR